MSDQANFGVLLERYFTQRMMQQRRASAHTIASYRDAFKMLLQFAHKRLRKAPSALRLDDIDAPLVMAGPDYRPLLLARPFDWIDNRKVIGTIRFSDNGAARMAWNNAGATWRAEANGDLVVSAGDKTTRLKYDPQSYTFSDGQTLLRPQ